MTASIGIAVAEEHSTGGELVRYADTAAYRAKERGRNCYEVFDEELRAATRHRAGDRDRAAPRARRGPAPAALPADRRSREPRDGRPRRAAAVAAPAARPARPRPVPRPRRKRPGSSCRSAVASSSSRARRLSGLDAPLTLAVNLSPRELAQPDLVDRICATLRNAGVDPTRLCLEITESALLEDADLALATLGLLKDAGVLLAIDDFGTGYSSLNYLRRLPVDIVKIDRSFVAELGRGGAGRHDHRRHHRPDARSRPRGRRRGDRAPRAGGRAPRARLHPRPGLPVLAGDLARSCTRIPERWAPARRGTRLTTTV